MSDEDVVPFFEEALDLAREALKDKADRPRRALAAAQVAATLALVEEVRRSNDARDDFYREVIATLRAFRETEG